MGQFDASAYSSICREWSNSRPDLFEGFRSSRSRWLCTNRCMLCLEANHTSQYPNSGLNGTTEYCPRVTRCAMVYLLVQVQARCRLHYLLRELPGCHRTDALKEKQHTPSCTSLDRSLHIQPARHRVLHLATAIGDARISSAARCWVVLAEMPIWQTTCSTLTQLKIRIQTRSAAVATSSWVGLVNYVNEEFDSKGGIIGTAYLHIVTHPVFRTVYLSNIATVDWSSMSASHSVISGNFRMVLHPFGDAMLAVAKRPRK